MQTYSLPPKERLRQARYSSCHTLSRREMAVAERPAASDSRNASSASQKSPYAAFLLTVRSFFERFPELLVLLRPDSNVKPASRSHLEGFLRALS